MFDSSAETSSMPAGDTFSASPSMNPNANMSYAKALNDAKVLIVQQSSRIKADALKIKTQSEEIAQLRSSVDGMSAELDRLRALEPQLAVAATGREQAEAIVGRQRLEIESLETASRELQRMLGEQATRINELTAEAEQLRSHLPTDEDAAALEQMAALLSTARAGAKSRPAAAAEARGSSPSDTLSGPALARQNRERQASEARDRQIVIPADPTPFCVVNQRQAA